MIASTSFIQTPLRSEQDSAFGDEAVLRFTIERRPEAVARCDVGGADVRGLAADEEDALLVSRRQCQRPGAAARPVEQAWSGAAAASRLRDVLCAASEVE